MTNRDRPASTQTKREKAAERYAGILLAANPDKELDDLAAHAVALADAVYDELDTPAELRGHEYTVQLPVVDEEDTEYKYVRGDIV